MENLEPKVYLMDPPLRLINNQKPVLVREYYYELAMHGYQILNLTIVVQLLIHMAVLVE